MSDAKKEVSAIGYSIVANVVDNVQMTFQHFVASDATDAQVNTDLDRIFGLIDRQRKLLAEPGLVKELRDLKASITQYALDIDKVEADWETAQGALVAQVAGLEARSKEIFDAAYDAHVQSGRAGEFKPRGATESQIRACATDVAKIKATLDNNVAERAQARQQLEIAMKARQGRVTVLEDELAEIAKLKADEG